MNQYIQFGENVVGYDVPVLNEREARAGAGILLLPAIISFMNAYLTHDFLFTKVFITLFMIDFFIRIFINPKYAPSLILGRIFVQNQSPEYVGATQKRFAWSIGFTLSVIMFTIIVILEIMTTIKIAICILCILLLFSEAALGICLGCIIYHKVFHKHPKYCPGNVCEIQTKTDIQKVSKLQVIVLILFFIGIVVSLFFSPKVDTNTQPSMKCSPGKCGGTM